MPKSGNAPPPPGAAPLSAAQAWQQASRPVTLFNESQQQDVFRKVDRKINEAVTGRQFSLMVRLQDGMQQHVVDYLQPRGFELCHVCDGVRPERGVFLEIRWKDAHIPNPHRDETARPFPPPIVQTREFNDHWECWRLRRKIELIASWD